MVENYAPAYPELKENQDYIKKMVTLEEERFNETIDSGMNILLGYIDELIKEGKDTLDGEKAFKLYDTFGFPYELTEEICEEKSLKVDREAFDKEMEFKLYDTFGFPYELTEEICEEKSLKVDREAFDKEMEDQRTRARNARGESSYMGSDELPINKIDAAVESEFLGYETLTCEGEVLVLADDNDFREELSEGEKGYLVSDKTPFYAEMGGQVGDKGIIHGEGFKIVVFDTKKNVGGKTVQYIKVEEGTVKVGSKVTLEVNRIRRSNICKNHTATHMSK